jgi:hypothetical protein
VPVAGQHLGQSRPADQSFSLTMRMSCNSPRGGRTIQTRGENFVLAAADVKRLAKRVISNPFW